MCPSSKRVLAEKGSATIHSCRDTYATRLLNNGMPLDKVSFLLGHATLQQTQKYAKYAKRPAADEARAILNQNMA
ncbi:tyrosine-type recombinase/integrase [Ruegeria sp. Ofav3-42]|nr:tyrosine-type recombinase/integrase [Ruegeria sp. Ofav3-42]MCG7520551.1 tyrosine-type recombinase/integrase [Ruegeria sp. Ofav3-42]